MKTVRTWCIRILMILFTIIFLYPLFWNLMSAFKTNAEYLTDPYALPVSLNLDNFVAAWQKANIAAYFGNSVFVTVLSTALLLLFVIPISYVLARYRFAGGKLPHIVLAALRISGKTALRGTYVAIYFPAAGAHIILSTVFYKSAHILWRIAEKQTDFMRKTVLLTKAFLQSDQTGIRRKIRITVILKDSSGF